MQRRSITAFNTTFEFSTQYKFVMEFCEEDACPVIVVKQPEGLQWLAIKKIADLDTSHILRKRCLREMKLMSKFYRHHQVASLYAADIVFRSADNVNFNEVYLYRDLELGGTPDRKEALARMGRLRENMKEEDSKSSWTLGADHHQQSFIHDVLRGLRCIHSANVVHCDIRPGSLLVDHRLQVKIYGFGLARRYSPDVPNNRGVSAAKQGFVTVDEETRWYRAPEFILGFENLTPAVDVWSVGCILAELLAGKPIFQGNDYLDQLHKIIDRLGKPSDDMLRRIGSTRLKDYIHSIPTKPPVHFKKLFPRANPLGVSLLEQLLELDPEKRITSEQAIKHPYFDFFRNHLSANVCDSPLDFSFEEEYTAEGTKQLIAKQVRAFSQRDWQQKSWMHSFREKVAGRPPSTGNVSPRAVDEVIWYPPVLEDDVGFGSDAALQPRFRLDDPGAEVERAVANIEIYSEQSEVQSFLSSLHARHERILRAERRFIVYKQSLSQLIVLCDAYASGYADHTAVVQKTQAEMTQVLGWYEKLSRWMESQAATDSISVLMKYEAVGKKLQEFYSLCPWAVREAAMDSLPVGTVPESLSPIFSEVIDGLRTIASNPTLVDRIALLSGGEAEMFVEILDKVLDTIDTSDHLRRKSFDLLRRICGQNHIIPKSFTLPPNAVRLISERPEASGGFADIWRGIYSGRTVAFKVFRVYKLEEITGSQADLKSVFQEAVVWRRLQHPNITPLYGIDEATFPSQLALVSDWMPHGTVASFLNQNTEANRLRLALDIAQGLQYLHEMNVVHGDMKSANVLVNERRAACISDFGLAAMSYSSKLVTVSVQAGSVRWMSPELLDPEEHGLERAELSPSSDVFALGMVLWELFTGRIPYYKVQKDAQVMTNILRNIRPRRPVQATPLGLSDDVWSLVEACWLVERRSRPSTAAVVGRLQDALAQHERAGANVAPQVWPLDVD